MNWYLLALRKYAVFTGRARRREYWIFELMNSVITLALFVMAIVLGKAGYPYFSSLPVLYALATTIPTLSSLVRRLHDTNRSGWWWFISAVPVIGPIILLNTRHRQRPRRKPIRPKPQTADYSSGDRQPSNGVPRASHRSAMRSGRARPLRSSLFHAD
jgi:uncharacterized membrane protein YhaH (DUF805 family)